VSAEVESDLDGEEQAQWRVRSSSARRPLVAGASAVSRARVRGRFAQCAPSRAGVSV